MGELQFYFQNEKLYNKHETRQKPILVYEQINKRRKFNEVIYNKSGTV